MEINKMSSEDRNQIAVCLLNSDLQEIEDDLVAQCSAWLGLDAESKQKYRDTMNALYEARSLSTEAERLKQENVCLVIKRMQLKRQIDDIKNGIEQTLEIRCDIEKSLNQEKQKMERNTYKYEEFLRDKADKFREGRCYYNKEAMEGEIEKVNKIIEELEDEGNKRRRDVDQLKQQLDELGPVVPDDLLTIIGKKELDEKVKALTAELEALMQKRNEFSQNCSA